MNEIAKIIDDKNIEIFDLANFDIDAIMHSGQVFSYYKKQGGYILISGGNYADIAKDCGKIKICCNDAKHFYNYFDLQTDYGKIKRQIQSDISGINHILDIGGGIRILKADFLQTVVSFIISANNNIKRFTKTLNLLHEKYGEKLYDNYYSFPPLEKLLQIDEAQFKELGCGYRSRYLVGAIRQVANLDVSKLSKLTNFELKKELIKIDGVGEKVASCIMLFASPFHRLDCLPIDTWIRGALESFDKDIKQNIINHKFSGVIQQYIFYFVQHLRRQL